MNTEITPQPKEISPDVLASVVLKGDISQLNQLQKVEYFNHVCRSLGLNPATQPLAYIRLGGKEVLYAKKDATDQLRRIYGVSIYKLEKEIQEGLYVVTAYARDKNGKQDSDVGVVPIQGLKGDALANAMLKTVTKAKRRVTLSICGLGLLDETEVDSIAGAEVVEASPLAPTTRDVIQDSKRELIAASEDPGEFKPSIGKLKSRRLCEVSVDELTIYVEEIKGAIRKTGKRLNADQQRVFEMASRHLESRLAVLFPNTEAESQAGREIVDSSEVPF